MLSQPPLHLSRLLYFLNVDEEMVKTDIYCSILLTWSSRVIYPPFYWDCFSFFSKCGGFMFRSAPVLQHIQSLPT